MRRNMAQSLFQYGQIETTLIKAKEVRPFVERMITLARKGTLQSRQRLLSMLGDRAVISKDDQEKYDAMSEAQRHKVIYARTGRRHRTGRVPASYNKKKIPFVAHSVVHRLIKEIAPKYADRPGGYTRIIRLSKRRIGDNSDLAVLQLVGEESGTESREKKSPGVRRRKTLDRIRFLQGKDERRGRAQRRSGGEAQSPARSSSAAPEPEETASQAADLPAGEETVTGDSGGAATQDQEREG